MFTLTREIITLDITSTTIRLLATRGGRIERWASTPIEPGLVEYGFVSDTTALGTKVKHLMKSSNMTSKRPILSINGLYSVCRLLHIPQTEEKSPEESLALAITMSMPLPAEELYISSHVILNDSTGQLALIIGLPRHIVNAQIEAMHSAKIKPQVLNLKGMALSKLVDQPQAVIVNMNPDTLDIALVVNGIPQIIRTVAQPPDLPLDLWVSRLVQAVEQTVHFHAYQRQGIPSDPNLPLLVAGEWADNPDVMEILQNSVPLTLMPPTIPLEYPPNLPVLQYAVNIGLALGQIPSPRTTKEGEPTTDIQETNA